MGALNHLKVLDLSRILAGPWCGQCLGDLGAEVLKIEHPDGGDDTRKWAPQTSWEKQVEPGAAQNCEALV